MPVQGEDRKGRPFMDERLVVFFSELDFQWKEIDRIYSKVESKLDQANRQPADESVLDSLAYKLHNLYSAYEDMFKIVTKFFENQIQEKSAFHIGLLKRMLMEIKGLRPALLSMESFKYLDELRGFRHVFRHAYAYELDPDRIIRVGRDALAVRALFKRDLEEFKSALKS